MYAAAAAVAAAAAAAAVCMVCCRRQLAALPLPPQLGVILLSSVSFNCVEEALTLVSMLSAEATLTTPFCISSIILNPKP